MVKTVEQGFREFHSRLSTTKAETAAARGHRRSIEDCLKRNFGITRFFRTGSFGNGTNIRYLSDVDYFASIPSDHQRSNSNTMLTLVRNSLNARFPNTSVRVSTPAVLVPFGTEASESTEVVPAYVVEKLRSGHFVYRIADGSGGWIRASPEAHNAYVSLVDNKLGKKVKPLIRFLKAWKYYRSVPIISFYLELRTTKHAAGESSIFYS